MVHIQLNFLLDLGVTHIINTSEQDVRIDPTKYAKQGICYKGFVCKVGNNIIISNQPPPPSNPAQTKW